MKRSIIALVICSALAGCGESSAVKDAVIRSLKDPDSAKFGKLSLAGENGACLTVNAKNSMGGYTGEQQAALCKMNGKWEVISMNRIGHELCLQLASTTCNK